MMGPPGLRQLCLRWRLDLRLGHRLMEDPRPGQEQIDSSVGTQLPYHCCFKHSLRLEPMLCGSSKASRVMLSGVRMKLRGRLSGLAAQTQIYP
jgi:hypothetical protein